MEQGNGLTLVVLAAGMGSRFGGLKQLEPLSDDGNILIEYSVFDAIRAGFDKVVFIVRRSFIDDFRKLVEPLSRHVAVDYAFQDEFDPPWLDLPQREKPWGTGHALLAAEHLIAEPMAVINADDYYGQSAYATAAKFLRKQANESTNYGMLGYRLRSVLSAHGTVSRGICQLAEDGKLATIVEHTKVAADGKKISALDGDGQPTTLSESQLASMNFWLFTPSFFPLLRREMQAFAEQYRDDEKAEFLLPDIVGRMLQSGEVTCDCLPHEDIWFGMTHREDRESAVQTIGKMHAGGSYPSPLWTG
ncbi:MAG: NTP transferase domain-containing protein [Woeseiaceae bacterium]|nr:NTP transferase domain-containing protein [Woeseiaceae bacterium]